MKRHWPKEEVDHKDRDKLNNEWGNLREISPTGNRTNIIRHNAYKWQGINKQEYRGRTYFVGRFSHEGKRFTTQVCNCPTAAAIKRDKLIKEVGAIFAVRNF